MNDPRTMKSTEETIADALRSVWLRNRRGILGDLEELLGAMKAWNSGPRGTELAIDLRTRAHRILGSLTMVGRADGAEDLRSIETRSDDDRRPYTKEAVDRIHGLLEHLRVVD